MPSILRELKNSYSNIQLLNVPYVLIILSVVDLNRNTHCQKLPETPGAQGVGTHRTPCRARGTGVASPRKDLRRGVRCCPRLRVPFFRPSEVTQGFMFISPKFISTF